MKVYDWNLEVYLHEPRGVHPHPTEPSSGSYLEAVKFIEKHLPVEIGLPVSVHIFKGIGKPAEDDQQEIDRQNIKYL